LSFFDSRPTQPLPSPTPGATGEPDNVVPGVVALEVLLGHTSTAAVAIGRLRAYPSGFALPLLVRLAEPAHMREVPLESGRGFRRDTTGFPASFLWGSRPNWAHEQGLPDDLLRVGIVFADGRAVTNLDTAGVGTGGPIRLSVLGVGGMRSWNYQLWVEPLPPAGALGLVCEWPAKGIPESRVEIDAGVVLQAAGRAVGRPAFLSMTDGA
jgi:hypothetical protein